MIKRLTMMLAGPLVLMACAGPLTPRDTQQAIQQVAAQAARPQPTTPPMTEEQALAALMPPLKLELPKRTAEPIEPRFDLVVKSAPAQDVFMAIISGTRYSMLVHPEVAGAISANLKNVTVPEALSSIRELYGYDYTIDGRRVVVHPLTAQTRIFKVNYLAGTRSGSSDTRVISGSVSGGGSGSGTSGGATGGSSQKSLETSKINTSLNSDFWGELKAALETIVGEAGKVIVSPQSGVVVVKTTSRSMRDVEKFLKATALAVERQVMLEAKILEVELNDGFQTGINWSVLNNGQHKFSSGANAGNFDLLTGAATGSLAAVLGSGLPAANGTTGGLLGLAFQTKSFSALINFLETQGSVHVLSSPRIAALNNQKAVLKVGTDDFFVTNVSTTSSTGGAGAGTTTPSVTLQPFFSGIALDVTPQIDEKGRITLHVRPSVSVVTEKIKNVDAGGAGSLTLPLASSAVSETDSVVQVEDGRIVAIGGMMKQSFDGNSNRVPGLGRIPLLGYFFGNTNQRSRKSELVILIKPTVINSQEDWQADAESTRARIEKLERSPSAP